MKRLAPALFLGLALLAGLAPAATAASQSRVYVPGCSADGGFVTVPANSEVVITTAWVASTKRHVREYLAALRLRAIVDGTALTNVKDHWGSITYSSSDGGWRVNWSYSIGQIARGQLRFVQMNFKITETITDGWWTYAPGTSKYYCTIKGRR